MRDREREQPVLLADLEPEWIKHDDDCKGWRTVGSRAEADGVQFLCPKCYREKGGVVGVHSIICWEPSVPKAMTPGPGRWTMEGDTFETLTLVAGSSSILLQGGCHAHFFLRHGKIFGA